MLQQDICDLGVKSSKDDPSQQEQKENISRTNYFPKAMAGNGVNQDRNKISNNNSPLSSFQNIDCSKGRKIGGSYPKLIAGKSKQSTGQSYPAPYILPKVSGVWKNRKKNETKNIQAADLNVLDNPGSWPALTSESSDGTGDAVTGSESMEKLGNAQWKISQVEEVANFQGTSGATFSEAPSDSATAGVPADWASVVRQYSVLSEDGGTLLESSNRTLTNGDLSMEPQQCSSPCRSSIARPLLHNTNVATTNSKSFSEILRTGSGDLCRRVPPGTAIGVDRGRNPRAADEAWGKDYAKRLGLPDQFENERSSFDVYKMFRSEFGISCVTPFPRRPVNLNRMQSPARSMDAAYEQHTDIKYPSQNSHEFGKTSNTYGERAENIYIPSLEVQLPSVENGMNDADRMMENSHKKSFLERHTGECALAMMSASKTLSEIIQENHNMKENTKDIGTQEEFFSQDCVATEHNCLLETQSKRIVESDTQEHDFIQCPELCEAFNQKDIISGKNCNKLDTQCCSQIVQNQIRILSRATDSNDSRLEIKPINTNQFCEQQLLPEKCVNLTSQKSFLGDSRIFDNCCFNSEDFVKNSNRNPSCIPQCNKLSTMAECHSSRLQKNWIDQSLEFDIKDINVTRESLVNRDDISKKQPTCGEDSLPNIEYKTESNLQKIKHNSIAGNLMSYNISKNLEVKVPDCTDIDKISQRQQNYIEESCAEFRELLDKENTQAEEAEQLSSYLGEHSTLNGKNPLQAPRLIKEVKLKKQSSIGRKTHVKAVLDISGRCKHCSRKIQNTESNNLSSSFQHFKISPQQAACTKKMIQLGSDVKSNIPTNDTVEQNGQKVEQNNSQLTKRQNQYTKKPPGATAGTIVSPGSHNSTVKQMDLKFRSESRLCVFPTNYQRGRRKMPVISTKYRFIASQRTSRTEPNCHHVHQCSGLKSFTSCSYAQQKSSALSDSCSNNKTLNCSDGFHKTSHKPGGNTDSTQVLLKHSVLSSSKTTSNSVHQATQKAVQMTNRLPGKKESLQCHGETVVEASSGKRKANMRKCTLTRHSRNRTLVRSTQFRSSNLEDDPRLCYTMPDGRKILFSQNAVNTPLIKIKNGDQTFRYVNVENVVESDNAGEELPALKKATNTNTSSQVCEESFKGDTLKEESHTSTTSGKCKKETVEHTQQKMELIASESQCISVSDKGDTKHQKDASAAPSTAEMSSHASVINSNVFPFSCSLAEKQSSCQQQQQTVYSDGIYSDQYRQNVPNLHTNHTDVLNRSVVPSPAITPIRQNQYIRDTPTCADEMQQPLQQLSCNPDINGSRAFIDASVNLLCESLKCLVQSEAHFDIKALPRPTGAPLQLLTSSFGLMPVREQPTALPVSNALIPQPLVLDLQRFVHHNSQQHNTPPVERLLANECLLQESTRRTSFVYRNSSCFVDSWTPFGAPPLPEHDWSQYYASMQPSDFMRTGPPPGANTECPQTSGREQYISHSYPLDEGVQLQECTPRGNANCYTSIRRSMSTSTILQ